MLFNTAHHTYRAIPLDGRSHIQESVKLWMGDSLGRWEGNTLVVDVTNNNDQTWFDIVGDFHSDALHVAERFTPVDAETIEYEATITDPKVYYEAVEDGAPYRAEEGLTLLLSFGRKRATRITHNLWRGY